MSYRSQALAFANAKLHSDFQWGQNDCNTLALEFIQFAFPNVENLLPSVVGQYDRYRPAVRFYRSLNRTWDDYLRDNNFHEVMPMYFQPGDLHIYSLTRSLDTVTISLGEYNLSADMHKGVILDDFFRLNEQYRVRAYRYGGD